MKCPKCDSENIEVINTFPGIDYAEEGQYWVKYKCKVCKFEFQRMYFAEEPMFD